MDTPLETVVYADERTSSVLWLQDGTLLISPLLPDGTFSTDDGAIAGPRNKVANDLAAHDKRIEAALHRAGGRPDLAESAEREAAFYEDCADRAEAACMGHRELGGVKPPIVEASIVRMTLQSGPNPAPTGLPA